ncbi:hypothetical protein L7F22_040251 [Adiantum nelumboides]|nr:hypothetical protein [Adiantum nelumboides]
MDCNRDEAARSRSIAEKKFMQQDYAGARKFALKARQLFPDLEGLVQFVAVMEVHATAQEKLQCGEMDWYGILQSDPSADEAFLRKQYRKLALVLHPDKNKSLGAGAAFKYISEAWTILSDKIKKASYDSKRFPPASKPVPAKKSGPTPQSKQTEKQPPRKKQTQKTPAASSQPQQSSHYASLPGMTFWTACPDCKLQFEYHIVYKHKNLCCPICLKPFFAKELTVLVNGQVLWRALHQQNGVRADNKGGLSSVNGHLGGAKFNTSLSSPQPEKAEANSEARKENIEVLSPWTSKEKMRKNEMDQLKSTFSGQNVLDPLVDMLNVEQGRKLSPEKSLGGVCKVASELKEMTSMGSLNHESSMKDNYIPNTQDTGMDCFVPDSDFYVFDSVRTEHCFANGQVWAFYDDDDGFPRYYARVVKVISQKPFKIQYTWLEARSSSEEVLSWLDSGFSYTCGEFKLGKTLTGDPVCMFSHIMTFEKGQKGGLTIYPRKGEIWALYKDWTSLITKDDKHGYELVEVLTDFSEDAGVQLCLLVKVEGFKPVYRQLSEVVYRVLPTEMRRFSHNIPARALSGGQVLDCIKGCFELDPASIPRE